MVANRSRALEEYRRLRADERRERKRGEVDSVAAIRARSAKKAARL